MSIAFNLIIIYNGIIIHIFFILYLVILTNIYKNVKTFHFDNFIIDIIYYQYIIFINIFIFNIILLPLFIYLFVLFLFFFLKKIYEFFDISTIFR